MIVVTGATGGFGGSVVRELLERVPADQVAVSVRDPRKADDLAARGVRVRRGDFAEPETLSEAFVGATTVLIVSANALGPTAVVQHVIAAQAAKDAGAKRVFYTAHQNVRPDSAFEASRNHGASEAGIAQVGVPWTALRNGYYAHTIPMLTRGAVETGELALPADGPVSWTAREDLAIAAARLLVDPPAEVGPTPALTGPEALTFDDVAALLAESSGKSVRRIVIDDDDWVRRVVGNGMEPWLADLMLGFFVAARSGDFATVDPALGEILGRPPRTVRDLVAA